MYNVVIGCDQTSFADLPPSRIIGKIVHATEIFGPTRERCAALFALGAAYKDPFTTDEDGIIGHLVRLGLENEEIEVILGRPANSVKKRRAVLGF